MKNKNVEITNFDAPLTNEELALFTQIDNRMSVGGYQDFIREIMKAFKDELIYLHGRIDQFEMNQLSMNNAIANGCKSIAESQAEVARVMRESATGMVAKPTTEQKEDTLFVSKMNAAQKTHWISKAKGLISSMVLDDPKLTYGTAWTKVYAGMAEDGYHIRDMYTEYEMTHPNTTSKIQMIASSDKLQESFLRSVANVNTPTVKAEAAKQNTKKKERLRTPKEVEELVALFSSTGQLAGTIYHKAFKALEDNGVDMNKVVENARVKLGRRNVKRAVAISLDDEAMEMLRKLAHEYANK